eukprot:540468_1
MSTEVSLKDTVDLILLSLGVIFQSIICIWWIITIYCPSTTISLGGYTQDDKSIDISPTGSISPTQSPKSIPKLNLPTIQTSSTSKDNNTETEMYNHTQKRKKKSFKQIPLIFKVLTTVSLFSALITLINIDVNHILGLYSGYAASCIGLSIPMIFLNVQRVTLFLYYIYRIELTFKDSVFSISETKLNIFKVTVIIMGAIAATFFMVFAEINQCDGLSLLIGLIPGGINDTVISTTTFILFISRLKKIIAFNDKANTNLKLKRMIKKLSILLCVTILSTIGAMGLYVIVPHVQIGCGTIGLWAIDTVINSLCLLLSYVFFNKYYNRLCFVCIKCVEIISKLDKSDTTNECDISPHVEI